MKKDLNYEELIQQNKKLQIKVNSLTDEVELLRKSFLPEESFYKDRFYRINENVNDVVYRFHIKERKYEYISPQVVSLFGYKAEEFYNNPFLFRKIIHKDYLQNFICNWKAIIAGDVPDFFEIKIIRRDGEVRWVMQKNLAIQNSEGDVILIEGIISDITERKQTEKALIESEAQKKAILNNLPHLAWMKDCDGVYLSVNESFAARLNKTADEIIGCTDNDFYDTEIVERYRKEDIQVILKKKQLYIEEKTGDDYFETFKAPIYNNKGDVIGITGISLEITKRKNAEVEIKDFSDKLATQNVKLKIINDELHQAKEKAEEADRLKTAFLANMSHEIRTPMNAILGFATLLRDRKLSEAKRVEFINLINTNCRQLLHIISDIIDISKIESNQITIFNKNFNINQTLQILKKNFEANVKKSTKDITINIELALEDKQANIYTDKVRLEQVLSNFLSNAIKFTDDGSIECGYTVDKIKGNIVFYVKDTGIGMTQDEQDVIFDRFRQVSTSYNKMYGGTGLGLAISKGLSKRLGGEIYVESEEGKGSSFYLSIPFRQGEVERPKKIAYQERYNWNNRTILIAEDEKANYSLLENIIIPTKAKILWARNGLEAVEICRKKSDIDLILMDIKMPEMNGLDATKEIIRNGSSVPIIAQTAFAMPQDEANCLNAGCVDYLSKPLKIDDILNKIDKYIHVYSSGEKPISKRIIDSNTKI